MGNEANVASREGKCARPFVVRKLRVARSARVPTYGEEAEHSMETSLPFGLEGLKARE